MTDREEFKIQILPADNPSNFFLMKKTEKVCKIKKRLYICIRFKNKQNDNNSKNNRKQRKSKST